MRGTFGFVLAVLLAAAFGCDRGIAACPAPEEPAAGWALLVTRDSAAELRLPRRFRDDGRYRVPAGATWYVAGVDPAEPQRPTTASLWLQTAEAAAETARAGPVEPLSAAGADAYSHCTEVIGGRPALVEAAPIDHDKGRGYLVRARWDLGGGRSLVAAGQAATARERDELLAALRTVRPLGPAGP